MATNVDICNLALALLGDSAEVTSINPPDGSDQAGHCARWYPMALKKLSEEFPWSFATKRSRLSEISSFDQKLYGYKHAYSIPSECVRLIQVSSMNYDKSRQPLFGDWRNDGSEIPDDFLVEGKMIFTDTENAMALYTSIPTVTSQYPAYFTDALVILLASLLVGPLKRSDSSSSMAQNLLKQYESALSRAKTLDASQSILKRERRYPSSIKSRWV